MITTGPTIATGKGPSGLPAAAQIARLLEDLAQEAVCWASAGWLNPSLRSASRPTRRPATPAV